MGIDAFVLGAQPVECLAVLALHAFAPIRDANTVTLLRRIGVGAMLVLRRRAPQLDIFGMGPLDVVVFSKAEPRRVCRRLQLLRGWSHDKQDDEQIFTRGPGQSGSDGSGSRQRAPIALGGSDLHCGQDRLHAADAAGVGHEGRDRQRAAGRRSDRHGRQAEGSRAGEPRASASQRDPAQGKRLFCDGGARPPVQAMIAFIDDHRGAHGVEPICKVLPIAPSTYHAHVAKRRDPAKLSARARQDAELKIEVRRVFDQNFSVYGVRKVWRQLKREGFDAARCTVSRLMRDMGLQGVIRGKPVKTTISDKAAPCPLDHVNRQFKAPRPNVLWLSDFTYVATWTGFVYVAFVIDAYARRIVGWRASRTAHAGFVLDALEQALHDRRPLHRGGLVHHSDRGSQYVSIKYTERLAEAGVEPSVGSVGDSYDNALAETINGLYKAEVIHRRGPWKTRETAVAISLDKTGYGLSSAPHQGISIFL